MNVLVMLAWFASRDCRSAGFPDDVRLSVKPGGELPCAFPMPPLPGLLNRLGRPSCAEGWLASGLAAEPGEAALAPGLIGGDEEE